MNTDQGSQFTAQDFIDAVLPAAKLSMDGKGRATDNAFVERFWRSLKYEKLYMSPASSVLELWNQINQYIEYYNKERRHSSIENMKPIEKYTLKKQVA